MRTFRLLLVSVLFGMVGSWVFAAGEQPCMAESLMGIKDATNSPVVIRLTLKSSSLVDGISMRVEIENQSAEPYRLQVCPAMKLCCVSGLHPMVSYGKTGMGLVDKCAQQEPAGHELFLPSGAAFSFNVHLAPGTLPAEAVGAGKIINVFFCYELGEQGLVHSNVVQAELR